MKIIHTSDWHIGQLFNFHYDRQLEHQFFFDQLKKIIKEEKPDALIVSGDIYDKSTPANSSMRFFFDNLLKIVEVDKDMTIVITAGNHDSSSRLETDQGVWKLHNCHFVGSIERDNDQYLFDKHIIKVGDKGFIVAVPYLQNYYNDFYNLILKDVEKRNINNLPVILMGHTTIADSDFSSHEIVNINEIVSIGGVNSLNIKEIDDSMYDYFALGHIHTPQTLSNGKARYCGTPVQINFKEDFQHSITKVEILKRGEMPNISTVDIQPLKFFYTIPSKPYILDEALKILEMNLPEASGYVQLNILVDGPVPADTENRIRNILSKNEKLLYCDYKTTMLVSNKTEKILKPEFGLVEFKEKDPLEIALSHFQSTYNYEMDSAMIELMRTVINEVRNEYYR